MGIAVGGSKRAIMSEMNVVPLIDVLLVLLVVFMIIPRRQTGLRAVAANAASSADTDRTRYRSDSGAGRGLFKNQRASG